MQSGMHYISWERHSNAYLLFYERVHPKKQLGPAKVVSDQPEKVNMEVEKPLVPQALPLVDNSDVIMTNAQVDLAESELPLVKSTSINNMEEPLYEAIKA